MNRLYYGDNLQILSSWPKWCVDLIYLDPPFNSNRTYNAIYSDATGRPLPDQVEAFCDTWTLDAEQEHQIRNIPVLMLDAGIDDETTEFWRLWMAALRHTQPRLLAYLAYMVPRLLHMKVVLKPTGSIYLHCDPTASHYIKVMMDGIFGHKNFRNEIVWCYRGLPSKAKKFQAKHDVILFYSNGGKPVFNILTGPPTEGSLKTFESGRKRGYNVNNSKKMATVFDWDKYHEAVDHGVIPPDLKPVEFSGGNPPLRDWWDDIKILGGPRNKERMGYPTQKPLALLDRIIAASSNPGDVVLDPFCGCATTLEAAQNLGREWIGIDIAIHAIKRVAKNRLEDRLGLVEGQDFTIDGIPRSFEGAQDLWERDKYHFQKWAVEEVDGFVTTRRSADGGIDGRTYFPLTPEAKNLESMAIEVKGGHNVGISVLRELRGVLDTDQALMAGLIVLHPPGNRQRKSFGSFMAQAGTLEAGGRSYERMQLLTVGEILDGNRFDTPGVSGRGLAEPVIAGLKLPPRQAPNL